MKRRLVLGAATAAAVASLACATSRRVVASLTANCKEVQPGVAFEMMRDNPNILSLDVRHDSEVTGERPRLPRSRSIPLSELPRRFRELQAWQRDPIVIFSGDGADAASACEFLARQEFLYVSHVAGGVEAWARRGFLRALVEPE